MRGKDEGPKEGGVHFAGDYVRTVEPKWFDELFFKTWERSAWWNLKEVLSFHNEREEVNNQRRISAEALSRAVVEKRNIVIWGANSVLKNKLVQMYGNKDWFSFYVDSDKKLENTLIDGKK